MFVPGLLILQLEEGTFHHVLAAAAQIENIDPEIDRIGEMIEEALLVGTNDTMIVIDDHEL